MLGITMPDLNKKQKSNCLKFPLKIKAHRKISTVRGRRFTSAKTGGYVLEVIYLSDRLSSGEVKHQDPVTTRNVLQPSERARNSEIVITQQIRLQKMIDDISLESLN